MKFSIYEIILLLTTILFFTLPKKKNSLIGWGYFLIILVLFEFFITHYWAKYLGYNYIPYNFFALLCASYYIRISYSKIKHKPISKYYRWISILWIICVSVIYLYNIKLNKALNISYVLGVFIALNMAFIYFNDIVENNQFDDITKKPFFYFTLGILIFFVCSFPILCFMNVLVSNEHVSKAFSDILKVGNICLYLGYLFTSLCCLKKPKFIGL